MKILIATFNEGKRREIESLLSGRLDIISLSHLEHTPEDYEETGSTFRINSRGKALYYHRETGLPTVADDSGLCVDALGGAPGALSARWAGESATDEMRIGKLLRELKSVPHETRTAHFTCSASFADGGRVIETIDGSVEGVILDSPAGGEGFGYDPIFYYPPFGKTFAEISHAEKNSVSHRAAAFKKMADALIKYFGQTS